MCGRKEKRRGKKTVGERGWSGEEEKRRRVKENFERKKKWGRRKSVGDNERLWGKEKEKGNEWGKVNRESEKRKKLGEKQREGQRKVWEKMKDCEEEKRKKEMNEVR